MNWVSPIVFETNVASTPRLSMKNVGYMLEFTGSKYYFKSGQEYPNNKGSYSFLNAGEKVKVAES